MTRFGNQKMWIELQLRRFSCLVYGHRWREFSASELSFKYCEVCGKNYKVFRKVSKR